MAEAEKEVESMAYRLTQESGRWLFLTPRLENVTNKKIESAPPLVKQIWEILEEQLEVAENRDDGGEIRHGSKRSDYRRLLEGAVHGQSVLCGE